MRANVWLRECIYKRVTKKGVKPGFKSSMLTFTVSAIWVGVPSFVSKLFVDVVFQHGVSPGYYLAFVYCGFMTNAARLVRSTIRPLFIPVPGQPATSPSFNKKIYDWSGTLLTILLVNYAAAPFMLLTLKDSLMCFDRLAWYGYYVVGGSLFFFYAGGMRALKKVQVKRVKDYQGRVIEERERERVDGMGCETESGSEVTTPNSSNETYVFPPISIVAQELEKQHEKML